MLIGIPTIYALFFGSPFIPTKKKDIQRILEHLPLKDGMTIYDLGCGDGRFLTTISKKATIQAIGYEYSPLVWFIAQIRNFLHRGKNVKIYYSSYFKANLSDADIIFLFLMPQRMEKIREKLQKECKKDTIVVSHGFKIPGLKEIRFLEKTNKHEFPTYFYNV